MSDQARLFEGSGPLIEIPEGIKPRQIAWYRGANRRLGSMHGRHGHGAEGRTCAGCAHLVRRYWDRTAFLKCELYNVDGYEGTDWRAKWPACGAYTIDLVGRGRRPALRLAEVVQMPASRRSLDVSQEAGTADRGGGVRAGPRDRVPNRNPSVPP